MYTLKDKDKIAEILNKRKEEEHKELKAIEDKFRDALNRTREEIRKVFKWNSITGSPIEKTANKDI